MAAPKPPTEKVRARKITNGYLVTRTGVTPRGSVYHREEYSEHKPGSEPPKKSVSSAPPPPKGGRQPNGRFTASSREVGFLNKR